MIRATGDQTMAFKNNGRPKKVYKDEKYYNCHKLGYFGHDCHQPDKKIAQIGGPSKRGHTDNRSRLWTLRQAYQTIKNIDDSDNVKLFAPGPVEKACMAKKLKKLDIDTWFLNLYTFCHLCNNQKLISNTKAKDINFVTVKK